jgi:putative membrane protein
MFVFLMLHAVGAHYGYTLVPIPWHEWGFARNNTDRVMHFTFGLLAVLPVEELLRRLARVRDGWRGALAVTCTFALAAGFEIIEWFAVLVGGDAVGPTEGGYLGTQGDEFDAVKDMALGLVGAATTMAILWASGRSHTSEPAPDRSI